MCSVQPLNRKAMPLWKAFPLSVLFVLCRRLHHESTGLPSLLKAIQGQSSLFKGKNKNPFFASPRATAPKSRPVGRRRVKTSQDGSKPVKAGKAVFEKYLFEKIAPFIPKSTIHIPKSALPAFASHQYLRYMKTKPPKFN